MPTMPRTKSKTLATWLALALGSLGAHRFYLHGWRDVIGWLHPLPALLGLAGAPTSHPRLIAIWPPRRQP